MRRIMILFVTLAFFQGVAQGEPAHLFDQRFEAVSQFQGTYSGTYVGTDSGTWTVRCDSVGNLIGISWSQVYGVADAGSGTVSSSGEFTSTMEGGAVLTGRIAGDGSVEGDWTNSPTDHSGTLQGRKNLPSELAGYTGRYSGTYSGTDNGTWDVIVDSSGYGSGSVRSTTYEETYSGYGIINASGEIMAVVSSGSVLHGTIDSSLSVSGTWYHPSSGSGTIAGSKISVPPEAPVISVSTSGVTVTIQWDGIPDALGYTLYYAPPDISYIQGLDVGKETHFSCPLWEGASFYVAVKAYNGYGSSGYSNIQLFKVENSSIAPDPAGLCICGTGSTNEFNDVDVNLCWDPSTHPSYVKEYAIEILDTATMTRRRIEEGIVSNKWSYAYGMNKADSNGCADENSDGANDALTIRLWAVDLYGRRSEGYDQISVTNPIPANVGEITSDAWMNGVQFFWPKNSEPDVEVYTYQWRIISEPETSWTDIKETSNLNLALFLNEDQRSSYPDGATFEIRVWAKDTWGQFSASPTVATETSDILHVEPKDIDSFAIDASKLFFLRYQCCKPITGELFSGLSREGGRDERPSLQSNPYLFAEPDRSEGPGSTFKRVPTPLTMPSIDP
jgi:hypothetical protein